MSTSRIVLWVISLAALFVLMLMNLWTVPFIRAEAQGLRIFDNRPIGYGFDEAKAFLSALQPDGLALYLNLQRGLDTLFPILFLIAMPWALWLLTEAWQKPYRVMICLVGVVGPLCDLIENHYVAGMLRAGPEGITPDMVARASAFSVAKWGLDVCAVAAFVVLSWNVLLHRWRPA